MSEAVADKHGDPKLFGTIETSKSIIEIPITDNNLSELNKRSHGGEGGEDAEDDADREERHRKKKKKSKDREKPDKEKKHKDKEKEKDKDEKKRSKHDRHSSRSKDRTVDASTEPAVARESRQSERDRSRDRSSRDRRGRSPDSRDRYSSSSRYHRDRDRDRDYDDSRSRSRERRERQRDRDSNRRGGSRDRGRDSSRDRDRDRGDRRDRSRDRSRDRGRDTSRRSLDRNNTTSSSSNKDKDSSKDTVSKSNKQEEEVNIHGYKQVTLKEVMTANPGISMPEAVVRLNMYNSAVVRNEIPPSLSTSAIPTVNSLGLMDSNILTKPHREIYVGNLPPGITVPQLAEFLNAALKQLGISADGNSVVTAWVSPDGHYGFVELKTIEEATAALAHLNGVQVGVHALRVGRPKGYNPVATIGGSALAVPMQPSSNMPLSALSLGNNVINTMTVSTAPGGGLSSNNPLMASLNFATGGGTGVAGGVGGEALSNVLMVSNLPAMITEEQIKELFTPFGPLRAFNLIKTTIGSSAGTQAAVFEYEQSELAESVVGGMNGLDVGGLKLLVVRIPVSSAAVLLRPKQAPPAVVGATEPAAKTAVAVPPVGPPKDPLESLPPTTVIRLSNMTTEEDLTDDQAYSEVIEDVAEECNAHATVRSVVIPREKDDKARGMVFVHCTDSAGAGRARQKVHGRKFNGKIVQAVFYPEELFVKGIHSLPSNYDPSNPSKIAVTAADELD